MFLEKDIKEGLKFRINQQIPFAYKPSILLIQFLLKELYV